MPSLNRNEKHVCEICGTQTTKLYLARHKWRYSTGSLKCPSRTNFSTKSRAEMNYHVAKKHSKATARFDHKGKKCDKDFHSYYKLREHKRKEHGAQTSWELKMLMLYT